MFLASSFYFFFNGKVSNFDVVAYVWLELDSRIIFFSLFIVLFCDVMDNVQLQMNWDFEGLWDVKEMILFLILLVEKWFSFPIFCKSLVGFGIPYLKQLNSRSVNIQLTVDQ